jgi:hypothetical protein
MKVLFLLVMFLPGWALAQEIVVLPSMCQSLSRHLPDADVTYQPGIDARGRAVVPADLSSGGQKMAQDIMDVPIRVPLTVDLAERLGIDRSGLSLDAPIGEISLENGQMMFNGRAINGIDPVALRAICSRKPHQ